MSKTRRLIRESIKYIDVVVEILDARIPRSGRNPNFNDILRGKPRIILLNKYDLADKAVTDLWIKEYESRGIKVIPVSCSTGYGIQKLRLPQKLLCMTGLKRKKQRVFQDR